MFAFVLHDVLALALTAGFLVVAGAGFTGWLRRGDRVAGNLGLASGLFAVICVAFRVEELAPSSTRFVFPVTIIALLGSGHALLMLRDAVIPLSSRTRRLTRSALAAVAVLVFSVGVPAYDSEPLSVAQAAAFVLVVAAWSGCVIEPMVRFWLRSRALSTVQRARMRGLSIGYGGLVAVLVASGTLLGSRTEEQARSAEMWMLLVSFVLVVVQLIAFLPPRWLRRVWRAREERALLYATGKDIYTATDREVVAQRGLEWAARLVGADRGVFAGPDCSVSARGFSAGQARDLVGRLPANGRARVARAVIGSSSPEALVVPVHLSSGIATIVLVAGPFTPRFGPDETIALDHFGQTLAAAMDRLRVDEMRTVFLTAVSHELRTPLTAVVGLGHTLMRPDAERLGTDRRRTLVEGIVRNAGRLEKMLSDLLDLDRLSRGVLRPRRRRVDMSLLVRRVVEETESLIGGRTVVVDANRPVEANLDAPMVERVVENLLANAAKHTPPGTTIWVGARADGPDLLLEVKDDGPGVPAEYRESIFTAFQRGPHAPTHSPGSGIGLSLVSRFAQLHGGYAWAEERKGGGACFKVLLPGAASAPQGMELVGAETRQGRSGETAARSIERSGKS